jgi:predicted TIM-barrel fold metal-dependent hydrolase
MSPADPVLEPYFALAEELDIAIGLHMGEGPPGGPVRFRRVIAPLSQSYPNSFTALRDSRRQAR